MSNNNLNYSYQELVHYLDMHTTDPMVRRLIDMICSCENGTTEQLIAAGMDPVSRTFYYDHMDLSISEYIFRLTQDLDYLDQDLDDARRELISERDARKRLQNRTVVQLLADMEADVRAARADADMQARKMSKVMAENAELENKLNVWSILARE